MTPKDKRIRRTARRVAAKIRARMNAKLEQMQAEQRAIMESVFGRIHDDNLIDLDHKAKGTLQ